MNRRAFLTALGLAPFALRAATFEPPKRSFDVIRMVMMPTVCLDENGQRIGTRRLGPLQRVTYKDCRTTELDDETSLLHLTRQDDTVDEFQVRGGMRVTETNITSFVIDSIHRIVGYRGIEVERLDLSIHIDRSDMNGTMVMDRIDDSLFTPPEIEASWQEVEWV